MLFRSTQFKHILQTLASMTESSYIRSSAVAEVLTGERGLRYSAGKSNLLADGVRPLDEIIEEVILQTLAANNGNRALTARQLGISRTTLWRYLGKSAE